MELEILKQLGVAVLLSGLVGLEREKKLQAKGYRSFAGLRTFIFIGLIGALAFVLLEVSVVITGILTAGFFGIVIASYFITSKTEEGVGGTSEMAAVLVYLIGFMAGMGDIVLATSVTLFLVFLLQFKEGLHEWVRNVKNVEFVSTLQFVLIAFVVLPILPNESFGPYGFFNPYIIWLMVVFISGISYASYIAIKVLGARKGISMTGFLAGLISSTALVLSFSGQSKKNKTIVNPYVVAVVVASSAMFFRVLVEVSVLNVELLGDVLVPMLSMGIVGAIAALYFFLRKGGDDEVKDSGVELANPFSLWPAVKFGTFFAVILLLSSAAQDLFGDYGVYATSLLSGVLDVDAITVSLANLAKTDVLSHDLAVQGITIAAMTNTLVKGVIFMFLGSRAVALRIIAVFTLMLITGGVSLFFI